MTLFLVAYDDIYELPLGICYTLASALRLKKYYEVTKGISCKIEVVEG